MARSETHTIAIVGQGTMARAHARAFSALGLGERIRYVCTPRPGAPLADAPSAAFVTELGEVLDDGEVDIVSVCTPTPTHAGIAVRALAAHRNVLLEKPIALTAAGAAEIVKASANSRGVLMIAHVVRFFDGYRLLREQVRDGLLGTVTAAVASRISSAPPSSSWLSDESASGGALVDFAIHDFDQVNLFLGTPIAVTAVERAGLGRDRLGGGVGRTIDTTVEYASGATGTVVTCADMPAGHPFSSSLRLTGSRGSQSADHTAGHAGMPFTEQAAYFLSCVENGVALEFCPVDAAVLALEVSLAAQRSFRTGATVEVSPPKPAATPVR